MLERGRGARRPVVAASAAAAPRTAPASTSLQCPTCDSGELVAYVGANPHKVGTGVCATCGQRSPLASTGADSSEEK